MKVKDLADIHNKSPLTVKRAIKAGVSNPDKSVTFDISGISYYAKKKDKNNIKSAWIISTDSDDVEQDSEHEAAENKSASFLLKKEQAKLKKLELEIKKLDENLSSTQEKIRTEIIDEAKEAVQDALLTIHNVYLSEFKPDKEQKERLDKALKNALENVDEIR